MQHADYVQAHTLTHLPRQGHLNPSDHPDIHLPSLQRGVVAGNPDEVRRQRQQQNSGDEDSLPWDGASLLFEEGGAGEDIAPDTEE